MHVRPVPKRAGGALVAAAIVALVLLAVAGLRVAEQGTQELQGHGQAPRAFDFSVGRAGQYRLALLGWQAQVGGYLTLPVDGQLGPIPPLTLIEGNDLAPPPRGWHRPFVDGLREGWQGLYQALRQLVSRLVAADAVPRAGKI